MTRLRYDQKRDANEPEIVEFLRAVGAGVFLMDAKDGWDLTVMYNGRLHILEVKEAGRYRLTKHEREVCRRMEEAGGTYHVVQSIKDAAEAIGLEFDDGHQDAPVRPLETTNGTQ